MSKFREMANNEAIYNLYLYTAGKNPPKEIESLRLAVERLDTSIKSRSAVPKSRELFRLEVLKNAIRSNPQLANSKISNISLSDDGLSACVFTRPGDSVSVVFKGTGAGEWIDNGEGLSGIAEENTYTTHEIDGKTLDTVIDSDYASDQQVEALNWFRKIYAENGWTDNTEIILSGHSKGGNKAQFIAMLSGKADNCFSFNGQGFSPEAIMMLKNQLGTEYENRIDRIFGFSTSNDFVSALGTRIIPDKNLHFLCPSEGAHNMEALLKKSGTLCEECPKSKFFSYMEDVSEEIMHMKPAKRRLATLGIMNLCQKYFGSGTPVNGDFVSFEATVAGVVIAIKTMLKRLF